MIRNKALLTCAKKYCIDNYNYWVGVYCEETTEEDRKHGGEFIFPRYLVLGAIKSELDLLTDKVFINFEDCRAQLKQVGQDASDFFTTNITSGAGLQVMNEGRAKFIDFVKNITDEQLESVVELPYGRKLSNEESKMIREKLLQVWNFDGDYWNPLTDNYKGEILVVISEFITDKDIEKIQSFLNVDNINHCYAVDENKNDYECGYISVTSCEEVCVDKRLDWLIYSSHEGTVSFAGTPLIAFVKELFIDRKEQLWHGW